MVTNEDLHIGLVKKKYPNGIQYMISRFRRPYPSKIEYIRRLDKEYDIIRKKGFVKTFHRVCDLLDLIKHTTRFTWKCGFILGMLPTRYIGHRPDRTKDTVD